MSSEIYSYLYDKLLDIGALDVYTESIYMKKNRPSIKLSVICNEMFLNDIIKHIMVETSTFGVRYNKYNRKTLSRKFKKVECEYGEVTLKLGFYEGELIKVTPEYEECKKIAEKLNLPLIKVYENINYFIKNKFIKIY